MLTVISLIAVVSLAILSFLKTKKEEREFCIKHVRNIQFSPYYVSYPCCGIPHYIREEIAEPIKYSRTEIVLESGEVLTHIGGNITDEVLRLISKGGKTQGYVKTRSLFSIERKTYFIYIENHLYAFEE